MYPTWWAWHESVLAIGLTLSDHFHPGSNVYRPMVAPPILTTWTCPWSKVRVSSGLSRPLFVTAMLLSPLRPGRAMPTDQQISQLRSADGHHLLPQCRFLHPSSHDRS